MNELWTAEKFSFLFCQVLFLSQQNVGYCARSQTLYHKTYEREGNLYFCDFADFYKMDDDCVWTCDCRASLQNIWLG